MTTNQPGDTQGREETDRQEETGSTLLRALRRLPAVVRGSRLYEWLTAEPEPEVVVIDLRETYTVGPFVRLLDSLIDRLGPYWAASTPKRVLDAVVRAGERAGETRAGRVALKLLAPPEPPGEGEGDDTDETREPAGDTEDDDSAGTS